MENNFDNNSEETAYEPSEPVFPDISDPFEIQKTEEPPKKKKIGFVAGVCAGLLVIGAVLAAFFVLGIFDSPQIKVYKAIYNTINDKSELREKLDISSVIESGDFTIDLAANVSLSGMSITEEVKVACAKDRREIFADITIPNLDYFTFNKFNFGIQTDSDTVKFYSDRLSDVYYLDFSKKPTGFLGEGDNYEVFEQLVSQFKRFAEADLTGNSESNEEMFKKLIMDLDFEKADKEYFDVNGTERKCQGYVTEVNPIELIGAMLSQDDDSFFNQYMASESVDDMEVTFYIYGGELAGIIFDIDDTDVMIAFEGGDYRTQNVVVKADREEILKVKGSTSYSVEKRKLLIDGEEVASYKYDVKRNEITLSADVQGYPVSLVFDIESGKDGLSVKLDDALVMGMGITALLDECKVEFVAGKGADISKITGNEIDLGAMSLAELDEFAYEIEAAFDF